MAKRLANWSSEKEVVFVEEIGKREGILFGKMKVWVCQNWGNSEQRVARDSRCYCGFLPLDKLILI